MFTLKDNFIELLKNKEILYEEDLRTILAREFEASSLFCDIYIKEISKGTSNVFEYFDLSSEYLVLSNKLVQLNGILFRIVAKEFFPNEVTLSFEVI